MQPPQLLNRRVEILSRDPNTPKRWGSVRKAPLHPDTRGSCERAFDAQLVGVARVVCSERPDVASRTRPDVSHEQPQSNKKVLVCASQLRRGSPEHLEHHEHHEHHADG